MASTVGRISGQMLESNLQREGVDLAFETDLVYLNVTPQFVGINTDLPTRNLTVNGTTVVPDIIADTRFSTTELDIVGNEILNTNGNIQLSVTGTGQITAPKITTDGLFLNNNQIGSERSNESVDFEVTGTGRFNIRSNSTVYGDLHSTGNITFDGNMTFGDSDTDSIGFSADIASNITPNDTLTYSLGLDTKRWANIYPVRLNSVYLDAGTVTIGGSTLDARQGKIWYVAKNGHYDNFGDHVSSPFPTIEQALANALAGDLVFIYPGTYVELFPLVVPVGVSVRGNDIRQVIITPDTSSTHEDVFYVNGETSVEDLTIKDFYYDSLNDKGYAFRFAPGFKVTSRSPYIRNISVITKGSVTSNGETTQLNQNVSGTSSSTGFFFYGWADDPGQVNPPFGVIQIGWSCVQIPGSLVTAVGDGVTDYNITISGGSFASGGFYSFVGPNDPRGFDAQDAGRGAMIDGSVADPTSNQASMLFHSVTFITPGATALIATNGVRVEWLNSFIYFAEFGIRLTNGTLGFASQAATSQVVTGGTPGETWAAPRTLTPIGTSNGKSVYTYYDETLEWTGTYWKYWNSTIGSGVWYQSTDDTTYPWQATNWTAVGAALPVPTFSAVAKFGAEMRSIGSANVYGTHGVVADGADTLAYLITHNFGYIGTGKDSSNDRAATIEANEVIELNNGNIYYTSLDHKGLFKVGDTFRVDGETGAVTFATQSINISGVASFNFASGTNRTSIDANQTTTGNIQITNNRILSTTGYIDITPQNTQLQVTSNLTVASLKNLSLLSNLSIDSNTTFGSTGSSTVTVNPRIDQSLIPIVSKTSSLGTDSLRWNTMWLNQINLDDIRISSSTIQTTLSNSDLDLQSNGSGSIFIEDLKFRNGIITNVSTGTESARSVIFSPNGTGNTKLVSTQSLVLPKGTTATRVLSESAEVRYNTSYNVPEGYTSSGLNSLYSLYDSDRNTYVSSELTPNTSDNTLRFYTNGTQQVSITEQQVTAARFRVDDVDINNRLIQTINTNSDLNFDLNGTGNLVIRGFTIRESLLTNNNLNTATTIQSTGNGYVKFVGPALQIPYGNDLQRAGFPSTIDVGTHRWNTQRGYLEVYNGTVWQIATGEGEEVNVDIMTEFTNTWALIMG